MTATFAPEAATAARPVILFDGHCALCNASVAFVLRHERAALHRFAPLQSEWARTTLRDAGRDPDALDTMVLIDAHGVHERSTAALRVAADLRAPWRWLAWLRIVPRPVRDAIYALIGRLRYRVFGRSAFCSVAGSAAEDRFLATDTTPSA